MAYGKTQLKILEVMHEMTEECDYHYDMYMLIDETGAKRPNIHRAIKVLIADGLVISWNDKTSAWNGDLPKQIKVYMLASKAIENRKELDIKAKNRAVKLTEDTKEAVKLGLDVEEYQMKRMFGQL